MPGQSSNPTSICLALCLLNVARAVTSKLFGKFQCQVRIRGGQIEESVWCSVGCHGVAQEQSKDRTAWNIWPSAMGGKLMEGVQTWSGLKVREEEDIFIYKIDKICHRFCSVEDCNRPAGVLKKQKGKRKFIFTKHLLRIHLHPSESMKSSCRWTAAHRRY